MLPHHAASGEIISGAKLLRLNPGGPYTGSASTKLFEFAGGDLRKAFPFATATSYRRGGISASTPNYGGWVGRATGRKEFIVIRIITAKVGSWFWH